MGKLEKSITILTVWRYAIGIQVIGKMPLQFSIYHSQAIMYLSHKHGPICQVKYFYMFPYCPGPTWIRGGNRPSHPPSAPHARLRRRRRHGARAPVRLLQLAPPLPAPPPSCAAAFLLPDLSFSARIPVRPAPGAVRPPPPRRRPQHWRGWRRRDGFVGLLRG